MTQENILRSAVEGATFALRFGVDELASLGVAAEEIVLTGGGSGSPTWRQIIADVCGAPVTILEQQEGAAFGAALQAVSALDGSPPIEDRWQKRELLCRLVAGGNEAEAEYGLTPADLLAEREAVAPEYFEAACESIGELLADDSPVCLGVECRVGYHEVPSFAELGELFERFPHPRLGYWHDTGHAAIQEAMGLVDQCEWLRRFRDRVVGVHLHDVVRRERLVDHYPPGAGFLDLAQVRDLLPATAICVMEVSSRFIAEEVAMGLEHLRSVGF